MVGVARIDRWLRFAAAACIATGVAPRAGAQLPDKFTNLQVLPQDIGKGELVQTMKGFALGLGVRCTHCHVGEEGQPLSTYDFASDAKAPKKSARTMLQMVQEINSKFIPQVEGDAAKRVAVSCVTCHHGLSKPRTIDAVLSERIAAGGIDAAVAEYRSLREKHYGSFAYDFSEGTLNAYAAQLAEQDKNAEAMRVLQLNAEYYPRSSATMFFMGQLHLQSGEAAEAKASFEKALEFDPNNQGAKRALEKMSAAK